MKCVKPLALVFVCLFFFISSCLAQLSLFYPLWVKYPQDGVADQLSSSSCELITNRNRAAAKLAAFQSASLEIANFIYGTSLEIAYEVDGIYIVETEEVLDDGRRYLCLLAAINTQSLLRHKNFQVDRQGKVLEEEFVALLDAYTTDQKKGQWTGAPYPQPKSDMDYYANAVALKDYGNLDLSVLAYEEMFGLNDFLSDPHNEYQELLLGRYGRDNAVRVYARLRQQYPDNIAIEFAALHVDNRRILEVSNDQERQQVIHEEIGQLMDFVAEHPDYLPALDMLSWFVLKEYLERSGVEANIVVRMMGKHGQVETSLAILRAGAAANEQVLAAIAQNEHWEYFLHVENAQELERDAVYLRDRLAELKVDMFRYSTHRAVELGQEDDKTNGLLYPITLYCDSREHQMGINTMTKAAQIWYAIGSGPYVETPYTGGGLLNGRNGELLSNPEKKIPLCGWNGKGGPWPWIETTPNTIFPDLDINTRISVKYRELYSDEIIGPMVIQFRHQYGGRERVLKLTMCNSSGCWDDGMRHGSQMGGP